MKRPIQGFHRDEEQHWVAELSCGHGQHVRHHPPLVERPWVLTAEGRDARIGSELDCVRCDEREIPAGFAAYRKTPEFTEASLPDALREAHATKRGVWGCIHVTRGALEYRIHAPYDRREVLTPDAPGIVLPEVEHRVTPLGPVAFCVEFWRKAEGDSDA